MKYIRKTAALMLALLMVLNLGLSAFAAEGDPGITLTASKTAVNIGDEVTLTIGTDVTIAGVYGIGMKLYADSNVFEVVSIETTYTANNKLAEKGWIKLATTGTGNNLTVTGTIATVVLKAKAAAETTSIYISDLECTKSGVSESEKYVSVNTPPAVTATVTTAPPYSGYTVYASADRSTNLNGTATVQLYAGHSDTNVTAYNSYDLTVGYDKNKLSFDEENGYIPASAEDNVAISHDSDAGTIHIAGVGKGKTFDKPIAALTFTMTSTGAATVEIESTQISNQEQAVESDAPAAKEMGGEDETPGSAQIKVPFAVTKPDYVISEDIPLAGGSYTFSFADTDLYNYSAPSVTMNGNIVTPTANADGSYTISNITGDIVITATQTAKSFAVSFEENANATVSGAESATYGEDYVFDAEAKDGYRITSVTAAIGETALNPEIREGQYVIPGAEIKGDIAITVLTEALQSGTTAITIEGIAADKVVGGLNQTAPNGRDFNIVLLPEDGYTYTAAIGETALVTAVDEEIGNVTVTIPGTMINGTALTVKVTKVSAELPDLKIAVKQYIQLDEQAMFLVTASHGDAALAYEGVPMFWSEKYDAYCWLLISSEAMNSLEAVQAAAVDAITITTETAPEINYNNDINISGTVDINDAQLVYDMYTAQYNDFTETVTMEKFLKADVSGEDMTVDTFDAAAIVHSIVGNANAE